MWHLGKILVAQRYGILDDAQEIGMPCRFTITSKGHVVEGFVVGLALCQYLLKGCAYFLTCGALLVRTEVGIEATLAIQTVERTYLAVGRHEVDAQRYS